MPIRCDYQPIGGSHAQRDVFNIYLVDAAEKAGDLSLAKSLLAERVAVHPNSVSSWTKYAAVCDRTSDAAMADHARAQARRVESSA